MLRLSILLLSFLLAALSQAATVTQVKGQRALLELTGLEIAQAGDEVFAVDLEGRKRALLRITQVKGKRALAMIVRGRPQPGHELTLRSVGSSLSREVRESDMPTGEETVTPEYRQRLRKRYTGQSWGLLGEMLQTTMKVSFVSLGQTISATMKGSSFGALGYYDYPLTPQLQIRALAGVEQVTAAGTISTASCDGNTSTSCTFNVTYLSAHGQAKFVFPSSSDWRLWLNGGYGFLIALTKASTVIDQSNISTNQMYSLGVGMDIPAGSERYIPVSLEYGMFPRTPSVEANVLFLRVGYGWNL